MSIARNTNVFPRLAPFLLICATLIYGPRPAFAQTTESSGEQAQGAQSVSGATPSSDQASEAQQQRSTYSAICGIAHLTQRRVLAGAVCRRHRSCAPLRRTSTAESWDRQEQDRHEQHCLRLRFALCHFGRCRWALLPWAGDSQ